MIIDQTPGNLLLGNPPTNPSQGAYWDLYLQDDNGSYVYCGTVVYTDSTSPYHGDYVYGMMDGHTLTGIPGITIPFTTYSSDLDIKVGVPYVGWLKVYYSDEIEVVIDDAEPEQRKVIYFKANEVVIPRLIGIGEPPEGPEGPDEGDEEPAE